MLCPHHRNDFGHDLLDERLFCAVNIVHQLQQGLEEEEEEEEEQWAQKRRSIRELVDIAHFHNSIHV